MHAFLYSALVSSPLHCVLHPPPFSHLHLSSHPISFIVISFPLPAPPRPSLPSSLLSSPLLPSHLIRCHPTVSLTVGAYSEWIEAAPEASSLLPNLLNLLTMSLSVGEEASSAAALALKHICTGETKCTKVLPMLWQAYNVMHTRSL